MRRVKAKKSIFSLGLATLKSLNAALLGTSIIFICGQYHFFPLISIAYAYAILLLWLLFSYTSYVQCHIFVTLEFNIDISGNEA